MKVFGLNINKKILETTYTKYVPDKLSARFLYNIEGERLSRKEIIARCPGIKTSTIDQRLFHGKHTWADLQMSPQKSRALANYKCGKNFVAKRKASRMIAEDRRIAYTRNKEGHKQL